MLRLFTGTHPVRMVTFGVITPENCEIHLNCTFAILIRPKAHDQLTESRPKVHMCLWQPLYVPSMYASTHFTDLERM